MFAANGYVTQADHNLFLPLGNRARSEIESGSGKELGSDQKPGKLAAPWSSSALAVNVFEYWRDRDRSPLAKALECTDITDLKLEQRLETGFSNRAPANLDVMLKTETQDIGVESKFCEPYGGARHGGFRATYLRHDPDERWLGLQHLRKVAHAIDERTLKFKRLDAPQLIKHALAMQRQSSKTGRPFHLLLLWYCPDGTHFATREMQDEILILADAMRADGIAFLAQTYQSLFERLRTFSSQHSEYVTYLAARYFD